MSEKITSAFDTVFSKHFNEFSNIYHWNGTVRNSAITLPHHSWWVAALSKMIALEMELPKVVQLKVVEYALFHDIDEMFTGDIMHPLKYNEHNGEQIRDLLKDFVKQKSSSFFDVSFPVGKFLNEIINNGKKYDEKVKAIVKLADNLSLLNYSIVELKSGNKHFQDSFNYCSGSLLHSAFDRLYKAFESNKHDVIFGMNDYITEKIKEYVIEEKNN